MRELAVPPAPAELVDLARPEESCTMSCGVASGLTCPAPHAHTIREMSLKRLTPYDTIDALLQDLLARVQAVLGDQFVGMYLHGSLAAGDFEPGRSDIDFVVATTSELSAELVAALRAMHARLTASGGPWASRLEGSYIPRAALRRYDPAHASHPALRVDGSFDVDHHDSDWVLQRYVLREYGITLAGPPPQALVDPVGPDEMRQAARGILREWWLPQLSDTSRLQSGEYQAYAVLTMCRALYTLQHGAVASKPVAARRAQEELGPPWAALIAEALAWRHGMPFDHLPEALGLIRHTLARASIGIPHPDPHIDTDKHR